MIAGGTIVKLKSGGPDMTVINSPNSAEVTVLWFIDGYLKREIIPELALDLVVIDINKSALQEISSKCTFCNGNKVVNLDDSPGDPGTSPGGTPTKPCPACSPTEVRKGGWPPMVNSTPEAPPPPTKTTRVKLGG